MTSQDDQTTSSFDTGSGEDGSASAGLAAQTGAQAQTPSTVEGSTGDLASSPSDGQTREPAGDGPDNADADRGNLDGSAAHEDVRARSLSNSQDSASYTDSGEAGADNGSME
jgi:hypothetical protein